MVSNSIFYWRRLFWLAGLVVVIWFISANQPALADNWQHLSTAGGDLAEPSPEEEQVLTLILDIDRDGMNEMCIRDRHDVRQLRR